jgi:signal transduction histidine kinase
LRTCARAGEVCFEVADHGIGLSRWDLKRIFEKFYQVDRSLSRETGGCGLGLSIVKFIVEAHNGSVEVTSRPGQGSTFTIRLPAAKPGEG